MIILTIQKRSITTFCMLICFCNSKNKRSSWCVNQYGTIIIVYSIISLTYDSRQLCFFDCNSRPWTKVVESISCLQSRRPGLSCRCVLFPIRSLNLSYDKLWPMTECAFCAEVRFTGGRLEANLNEVEKNKKNNSKINIHQLHIFVFQEKYIDSIFDWVPFKASIPEIPNEPEKCLK